jgi:hypothetical protein
LLSLSHTLKLLHLFADTATPIAARQRLSTLLERDIAQLKLQVEAVSTGTGSGGTGGGGGGGSGRRGADQS